jgi:hypothetical protein
MWQTHGHDKSRREDVVADEKGPKPSEYGVEVVGAEDQPKAKAGEPAYGVEAGVFTGGVTEDELKARLVQKFAAGTFVLNETEARSLAEVLDLRDALADAGAGSFFGDEQVAGPDNPTAGLSPATGSGGTPYRPDAATKETKKAAKEAESRLDKDDYPEQPTAVSHLRVTDKRLAASVKE